MKQKTTFKLLGFVNQSGHVCCILRCYLPVCHTFDYKMYLFAQINIEQHRYRVKYNSINGHCTGSPSKLCQ